MIKLLSFSVQNKQNKKDTFFSNPKFWLFYDFLKLEVFPEENPTQKLPNSLGPRRNWEELSECIHRFVFFARNSQNFEKDYKITFIDKKSISNIPQN